jgi:hypothetical protein
MTDPRVQEYERRHGCRLLGSLGPGPGQDGFVMRSDRLTAVKFFDRAERFGRELEVYQVLQAKGIHEIVGHAVPELIASNAELHAIEMTIVERPFVLDFAGAKKPHEVPDFEQHVLDEHREHLREMFGEQVDDALHVAEMFRIQTGFVLLDIHPGNIAFADVPPADAP